LDKLGLNLGFLVFQILAFAIVFVVLRAWVYKPVLKMLEKRRSTIAQGLEDARIAAEARANAEEEAGRILADAQAKAADIVRQATERAETAGREVRAAAEVELAREREAAREEIEEERNRILGELRSQVIMLAMSATQKLIGDAMDEKRQHALLQEFFSGVKGGKVVVLEGAELTGTQAEVTSALPLTGEEQALVSKELADVLKTQPDISFRVDPTILGGVVVRVGDRVVDGSVVGKLQTLKQNLQ